MSDDLLDVCAAFALEGDLERAVPYGSGHIHRTWLATIRAPGGPARYVLQHLNTEVFRDPDVLAENLVRVCDHLRARLRAARAEDAERRCLAPLPTRAGGIHHRDAAGGIWRAFPYIAGTRSMDVVDGPARAGEAARAFGAFLAALADLPGPPLRPSIPHFHDLPRRMAALDSALAADPCGRAGEVRAEADRCRRGAHGVAGRLDTLGPAATPRRTVHNDCKINNVLFDARSGEALCVIDLDTVMPGAALDDFGELVRTACCKAPEDEVRLERIRVDLGLFRSLAAGFLAGSAGLLGAAERRALPLAGPRMALENAVRFLTDHVEGDRYFRIHRPGHNLDRARAQLQLAERLLAEHDALEHIVAEAGA